MVCPQKTLQETNLSSECSLHLLLQILSNHNDMKLEISLKKKMGQSKIGGDFWGLGGSVVKDLLSAQVVIPRSWDLATNQAHCSVGSTLLPLPPPCLRSSLAVSLSVRYINNLKKICGDLTTCYWTTNSQRRNQKKFRSTWHWWKRQPTKTYGMQQK